MEVLTPSLEDYLEAIWVTGLKEKVVRVKDLAERLRIKPASVVGALKTLKEKGFVVHERYGYIELTERGISAAKEIYRRHKTIYRFLNEVLGLPPETAEMDACAIEHHLSAEGLERMLAFIKFIEGCPDGEPLWLTSFHYFIETGRRPDHCPRGARMNGMTLKELKPGEKGEIVKLKGEGPVKRRLLDMGIVPGETVEVVKVAPLGDPMEVRVKGYQLSLRKGEAESVIVERK
ncbi:TPA: DtxR family transcriptional regulator [Candidatus Poribacteria bacterium]|nr:DtxR family transcriptional regulator [Candidatus Poribacteria bacterium]